VKAAAPRRWLGWLTRAAQVDEETEAYAAPETFRTTVHMPELSDFTEAAKERIALMANRMFDEVGGPQNTRIRDGKAEHVGFTIDPVVVTRSEMDVRLVQIAMAFQPSRHAPGRGLPPVMAHRLMKRLRWGKRDGATSCLVDVGEAHAGHELRLRVVVQFFIDA